MSGYATISEAVYKILCGDDLLLDLLEFVEPAEGETPSYSIVNGWPDEEIELTAAQPARLFITSESDITHYRYDRDELIQVRIIATGRDLVEDLKNRVFDLIDEEFAGVNESRFTSASGRLQLGGGRATAGQTLYESTGDYWTVNVRFSVQTVMKG